jgi:hypothetical protein
MTLSLEHGRDHAPLLEAWHDDPVLRRFQLTHAAERGRSVALCGMKISAWGDPWPDMVSSAAPKPRCSVCSQATQHCPHAPG